MAIYGHYAGAPGSGDTTTGPSGKLFARFDAAERDGRVITQYDPFTKFRLDLNDVFAPGATELYWCNGWKAVGTATTSLFGRIDSPAGGITLISDTADNDYLHMAQCITPFEISRTSQPLAFEARIKVAGIANTLSDFFVGLATGFKLTSAVPITATAGDLATQDLVGFHRAATDGDEINSVCCSADASHTVIQDGLATLVADTYVKLGMLWDPAKDYDLRFFVNGIESATRHTVSATAGDTFPNNKRLGLIIAMTAAAASAGLHTVQWIKCSQFRADSA
jgi:hypothetical protein